MKLSSLALSALLSFAAAPVLACSPASISGANQAVTPGKGFNQDLLDAAILSHVNFERCKKGLVALSSSDGLIKNAGGHSKWMAKTQKLTHGNASSFKSRLRGSGIQMTMGAENIATVYFYQIAGREFFPGAGKCEFRDGRKNIIPVHSYGSMAARLVASWMRSPGHRKNILDPRIKVTGSAAAYTADVPYCGKFFVTQEFVG